MMSLRDHRRSLEGLAEQISETLAKKPLVAAVWLGGSLGRGEGDGLSDVDLVVVAAPGKVGELVTSVRAGLDLAGEVALVHEAPQNAPADGAQLNVLYDTKPLPIYVDWNVWPHVDERPSDVRKLFEREPVRAGARPFHSALDDMPRGTGTPLDDRLSAFRAFMVPILMKYATRGRFESVAEVLNYMRIPGDPPASFDEARDLATSILAEAKPDAKALRTMRRYIKELHRLRRD